MKVNEHWKNLKPQIGAFVSELDNLCKGAENIDEALAKAEEKGYKRGFTDDKYTICESCQAKEFLKKCNGYIDAIKKFMELSSGSKLSVKTMILQLYHLEKLEHKGE